MIELAEPFVTVLGIPQDGTFPSAKYYCNDEDRRAACVPIPTALASAGG
jgi:hypothetical protein